MIQGLIRAGLMVFFLAVAGVETGPEVPDYGAIFSAIITKASMQLQQAAAKRPHKLKAMNDATAETARAALLMASRGGTEEILQHLERARQAYPGDSFSWLLQAVTENSRGNTDAANRDFETFLLKSRTYSPFEQPFVSWDDFHSLRRIVYELLLSRGVSFKGREKEIQVKIPFRALMEYIQHPSREDKVLNVGFIAALFGGALGLFAGWLFGAEYWRAPLRSVVIFYATVWAAYGVWIYDLAFGIPGGGSRFGVVPWLLGSSFCALVAMEIWRRIKILKTPLEEGYQRCRHCGEVFGLLMLECPRCRRSAAPRGR